MFKTNADLAEEATPYHDKNDNYYHDKNDDHYRDKDGDENDLDNGNEDGHVYHCYDSLDGHQTHPIHFFYIFLASEPAG